MSIIVIVVPTDLILLGDLVCASVTMDILFMEHNVFPTKTMELALKQTVPLEPSSTANKRNVFHVLQVV